MGDREETDRENQERENNADAPLRPAIAQAAPNADQPHGENVQNGAAHNPEEPPQWFRSPAWWMVILTGLLFVVGVVTLKVFYKQFGEMQTQSGILNRQAAQAAKDSIEAGRKVDEQLIIARQQASAAQASAAAIQRQMRQDQRPWIKIAIDDTKFAQLVPGNWLASTVRITSTGKTPILNLFGKIRLEPVDYGKSPTLQYPHFSEIEGGMLSPTESIDAPAVQLDGVAGRKELSIPHKLTQPEIDSLKSGKTYVAIYGRLTYSDGFGIQHWHQFCRVNFFHIVLPLNQYEATKQCIHYNGADSN